MLKTIFLALLKACGLFTLARKITARRPRILCYHGIAVEDEYQLFPGVFMRSNTFARRMALVKKWGYSPVSMDELYQQHQAGQYKKNTLVITIDDGWAAIEQGMLPTLKKYGFNATLYLSTYFVFNQRPIFKLTCFYLFWKYKRPFTVANNSCLKPYTDANELTVHQVLQIAAQLGSAREQAILLELAAFFGEDIQRWPQTGKFMFLTPEKVTALAEQGLAIELHTHRHKFSNLTIEDATAEITTNQQYIEQLTGKKAKHFCYPSGEYQLEQLALLTKAKIKTATTTDNELVAHKTPLLTLPRLVDSDKISDLEFEAELTGVMTLLRQIILPFKQFKHR